MAKIVLVLLGGALGTGLRYLLSSFIHSKVKEPTFPYANLAITVSGSFLIGILAELFEDRERPGSSTVAARETDRARARGDASGCKCPSQNKLSAVGLARCIFVTISGHHSVLYFGEGRNHPY